MLRLLLAVSICVLAAGCAKRPDAIAAAPTPVDAYSGMTCQNLGSLYTVERAKLAALTTAQNSAATGDAVGVFLIGLPTSTLFGGDKEKEVAASKGKVDAIESAAASKKCVLPKVE